MTKPAGSLEPIDPNKGKWTDGLGALELSTLSGLAADINKAIDTTVKQVARGKIRVGKLLREARNEFESDQAFGTWRRENTMVQSKQHAHYLMQVAERFGDAPKLIEGANYSVMQELVLADQADIDWVEAKIDEGNVPTVVEVRKKVKQTQAERLGGGTNKKGQIRGPGVGTIASPNERINVVVGKELHLRIHDVLEREIKGIEGDLIILGLDPDPNVPCNPDVFEALDDYYEQHASEEHYKIVVRSIQRVEEDFKNF